MPRFSLKDVLIGVTAASIGFAMLAIAFHQPTRLPDQPISPGEAFLVAFGGVLAGFGLSFPIKWPPNRMICSMVGMFAAQAWQSGSSVGVITYVGLMALFAGIRAIRILRAKRDTGQSTPDK
jgi:hypothetical protein